MKKLFKSIVIVSLTILVLGFSNEVFAGNKDRSGQAGATELLINPWAATSGWGNAGMSTVHGVDAMWGNVAGITATNSIDLNFSYTSWLKGSEVNMFSFGFLARVSESVVAGLYVMSFSPGEIYKTTTENPDMTLGTFKPSMMNINIALAKSFSNSIHAGFVLKIINESISDMVGTGVALDAGIQYVAGITDNIHFGITLKNIGPTMKFGGDGITFKANPESFFGSSLTVIHRTDKFELPTQLNIAAAYDFNFDAGYRLTVAGNFTSNSFSKDQVTLGLEGSLKDYLVLRAGYTVENGMWGDIETDECTNVNTGLSLGASVQAPLGDKMKVSIDYSFRETKHWNGTHSVGARIIF
ncbi:MAG: PorV/PorQ family protein [Bacteroidales bacterium]|mgnify:FL=1|nr:PorV/PorQ family protein [Bacteroidales bacterium]MBQ2908216.1 PorV/PorQ family protein [Bacteroidales bacterium]MBR7176298.1 PorV/PorQ family protein [Bacteroidales bacterium]